MYFLLRAFELNTKKVRESLTNTGISFKIAWIVRALKVENVQNVHSSIHQFGKYFKDHKA